MGLFTFVVGNLRCVVCGHQGREPFQTKLFFTDYSNSSHEYTAGDWVVIDGLCNYARLHPWPKQHRLDVVMGDWDCSACGICWQWARVSFLIMGDARQEPLPVRIVSVSTFVPERPSDFDGVHFVEDELALLGTLGSPHKEEKVFAAMSVPDRIDRMIQAFQEWRQDVSDPSGR